jgi:hypothetical protein
MLAKRLFQKQTHKMAVGLSISIGQIVAVGCGRGVLEIIIIR